MDSRVASLNGTAEVSGSYYRRGGKPVSWVDFREKAENVAFRAKSDVKEVSWLYHRTPPGGPGQGRSKPLMPDMANSTWVVEVGCP
jgi:hypothetical protein